MTATMLDIVDRVPRQFTTGMFESTGLVPFLVPLKQEVVGDIGQVLWVLLGTVGVVLLIASANVANLFLVRAEGNEREIAVRAALGAGRLRLLRYFLTEGVVLGLLVGAVRDRIWSLDPNLPISAVTTLEQMLAASMARTTFAATMLGIAAVAALLLGSIGVCGVIAYMVSQRTSEIGVRMALGARASEVYGMVVRQGLVVVGIGVVVGLDGAAALTRVMTGLLFEIGPLDPLTFAAVPGALVAAGALACLLPARRAASTDPAVVLRGE